MRNKIMMAGTFVVMAAALQGCAVWEYVFGGPKPEDMNQIIMQVPAPIEAAPAAQVQQAPQYPTPWAHGQLLDR